MYELLHNLLDYIYTFEFYIRLWLSFVILRISKEEIKLKFREIERISLKIVNLSCHLSFNETCLNIYVHVYI